MTASQAANSLFAELDALASPLSMPKGSVLFRRGDPASAVYFLRRGTVALVWTDLSGIRPTDSLGPGSIIGLRAALIGEYSITARIVEAAKLGFLPAQKVLDMLQCNPTLMRATSKMLGVEGARMRSMMATGSNRVRRDPHPHFPG